MSIQYTPINRDISVKYPKMRLPSGLSILFPKVEVVNFTKEEENFDIFINMKEFELYATYTKNSIIVYFKNDGYNFKLCNIPSEIYEQISKLSQDIKDNLFIRPILKEITIIGSTAFRNLSFDILLKKTKKELEYQAYNKVENTEIKLIHSVEIREAIENEIKQREEAERLEEEKERERREAEGLNFVVLDFETANNRYDSICAIGIIVVEHSQITDSFYSLIKPSPFVFDKGNIAINKITPRKCKNAPLFKDIYPEIKGLLENKNVFSHYAEFDNNCLHKRLIADELEFIEFNHFCSYKTIKNSGVFCLDYKQTTIAEHYNIDYTPHNAISDANALAQILLYFCEDKSITHLDEYDFVKLPKLNNTKYRLKPDTVNFNRPQQRKINSPSPQTSENSSCFPCFICLLIAILGLVLAITIKTSSP